MVGWGGHCWDGYMGFKRRMCVMRGLESSVKALPGSLEKGRVREERGHDESGHQLDDETRLTLKQSAAVAIHYNTGNISQKNIHGRDRKLEHVQTSLPPLPLPSTSTRSLSL